MDTNDECFILYEVLETRFIPWLRAYEIGRVRKYTCLPLKDVKYYKPMYDYNLVNFRCVKPSFGFTASTF